MKRSSLIFLAATCALVGGAVVIGLFIIPTPWEQRKLSLDEARVRDLLTIYNAITTYHRANGRLPASLGALPGSPTLHLTDVATAALYEYAPNTSRAYQLCADFDRSSTGTTITYPPEASNWRHEKGHHCFSLSVPTPPGAPQ